MIDWRVGGHGNREEREGASVRRGRGTEAKDSQGSCTDERLLSVCCHRAPAILETYGLWTQTNSLSQDRLESWHITRWRRSPKNWVTRLIINLLA